MPRLLPELESLWLAAGLLSTFASATPIGTYLAEDPISSGDVVVTLEYQGPIVHPPGVPAGPTLHATVGIVCIEQVIDDGVVAVGPAPW